MKTSRVLALGLMIAFLALPVAAADNWSGWITDSHCGAKGAKAGHTDCAVKCMKEGHKLVFLNDADKKLYQVDNQELAKSHLGYEVVVTGKLEGETIKVESIAKKS